MIRGVSSSDLTHNASRGINEAESSPDMRTTGRKRFNYATATKAAWLVVTFR
jgi:hypothetical protein